MKTTAERMLSPLPRERRGGYRGPTSWNDKVGHRHGVVPLVTTLFGLGSSQRQSYEGLISPPTIRCDTHGHNQSHDWNRRSAHVRMVLEALTLLPLSIAMDPVAAEDEIYLDEMFPGSNFREFFAVSFMCAG